MDAGHEPGNLVLQFCAEDLVQAAKIADTWYWLQLVGSGILPKQHRVYVDDIDTQAQSMLGISRKSFDELTPPQFSEQCLAGARDMEAEASAAF